MLKSIDKFALGGILVGIIFAAGSFIRYFFWTPDIDRAIVYPLIGILIIAISYLYNSKISLEEGNENLRKDYTSFEDIVKEKLENIEEEINTHLNEVIKNQEVK